MIAGEPRPSRSIVSPSVARVAPVTRCLSVDAFSITTAGVAASCPLAINSSAIAPALRIAMISTSVPVICATASQFTRDFSWPGGRWPETTVTSWLTPRWVSDTPAAAGAEVTEVTPGSTLTGIPASAQAVTSSWPRPKMNGSPPLSRTTLSPAFAFSSMISLIRSWETWREYGILATSMTSAPRSAASSASVIAPR